jgi:hypothetical protein
VEELRLLQSGAQWACGQTAATLEQAADEIERLREGFLMAMQYDNKCPQTGQPCDASKLCACFLEVKGWCDLSRRNSHDR